MRPLTWSCTETVEDSAKKKKPARHPNRPLRVVHTVRHIYSHAAQRLLASSVNNTVALTSVIDMHPLVELSLVRHGVEMAALHVPEGGQVAGAGLFVADAISAALTQAVLPTVLRPAQTGETAIGLHLNTRAGLGTGRGAAAEPWKFKRNIINTQYTAKMKKVRSQWTEFMKRENQRPFENTVQKNACILGDAFRLKMNQTCAGPRETFTRRLLTG